MSNTLNCILLIDDNDADNFFHKRAIKLANFIGNVVVAENGGEAITYLSSADIFPELIFLDINMPQHNGWDFLEAYRQLKSVPPNTVIIMLTTSLNPDDEERAKTYPEITAFISKPLTTEIFKDIRSKYFTASGSSSVTGRP